MRCYWTLQLAQSKLWSDCVTERDFDGPEEAVKVVDEFVSMFKSMGVEVDDIDMHELVDDQREETTIEKTVKL